MIVISHKQAERLIRRQFDLLLSDEEWNALQNHLECCPKCCGYQYRFQCTERKISQCLRARWDLVTGPSSRLPQIVSKTKSKKIDRRINQATACFYIAVLSLVFFLVAVREQSIGIQEFIPDTGGNGKVPTPTTSQMPTRTPIPLIQPGQFPHIIAYESQTEGNAEIYLLNPGFDPVNLTQHPAEDTFPTWSPDGEWLAFLTDRDTLQQENRKNELYILSIAGNQMVQLTSETLVDWDGPLSWSADGKWIAVAGVLQDEMRQRSIYVVGVDGSGPRLLPHTQGGTSPKFGPYGDRLAFRQKEGSLDRIVIYHVNSGSFTFEDIPQSNHNQTAIDVAFDWPADGDGLYYTTALPLTSLIQPTSAPKCSKIIIQQIPNDEAWHEKLRDHFHLVGSEIAGTVCGVSWAPKEWVIYSADLQKQDEGISDYDTEANYTDFLDFTSAQPGNFHDAKRFTNLYIQSDLDRGSWSLDMRWVIFTAYEQGVNDVGLYAVRMPGLNLSWQLSGTNGAQSAAIPAGTVFRLSPGSVQSSLPRMRPFRARMKIEPHPVQVDMITNQIAR